MMIDIHITNYIGDIEASHTYFKNVKSAKQAAQNLAVCLPALLDFWGHVYTRIVISVKEVK